MIKIGDRIGAVMGQTEEGTIKLFGYGIYAGDEIPVEAVGDLAQICKEFGLTNPRLELDDGSVVYGCECWWGSEQELKDQKVINVNINDVRRELSFVPRPRLCLNINDVRREHRE